jgi:hypothetical protein
MTSALLHARDCILYSVNVWLVLGAKLAPASAAI